MQPLGPACLLMSHASCKLPSMLHARSLRALLGPLVSAHGGAVGQEAAHAASLLPRMCCTAVASTGSTPACITSADAGPRSDAASRISPPPCERPVSEHAARNSHPGFNSFASSTLWPSTQGHAGPMRRRFTSTADTTSPSAAPTQGTPGSASVSSHTQPADQAQQPTAWPVWDWQYVTGGNPGRKPAIKRPKRHQWLFCNPNYSPYPALPPKILVPHAPLTAMQQDEWRVYNQLRPTHRQRSNRRMRKAFMRWLALRDVDWRHAFNTGLASDVKATKKAEQKVLHQHRHEAWAAFKLSLPSKPSSGSSPPE